MSGMKCSRGITKLSVIFSADEISVGQMLKQKPEHNRENLIAIGLEMQCINKEYGKYCTVLYSTCTYK